MSKNILEASLEGAEHIVLLGHIHPDGDCIGTTLGLLNYLRENYPQIEAELFLDHPAAKFSYMNDFEKIHTEIVPEKQFDLCITLDASDKERLGGYAVYFDSAAKTLCIDHHRTNTGFAEQNYIIPDASSCSEVLYTLLDEAKISREAAECLYTGIVHDTGVFKYNSTTRKTMEIAGALMEKGVNAGEDHRRQLLPQDLRTEPDSRKSAAWQYTDSGWKMYFQCGFPERNGVLRCRYERSGWHYRSAPDYRRSGMCHFHL